MTWDKRKNGKPSAQSDKTLLHIMKNHSQTLGIIHIAVLYALYTRRLKQFEVITGYKQSAQLELEF